MPAFLRCPNIWNNESLLFLFFYLTFYLQTPIRPRSYRLILPQSAWFGPRAGKLKCNCPGRQIGQYWSKQIKNDAADKAWQGEKSALTMPDFSANRAEFWSTKLGKLSGTRRQALRMHLVFNCEATYWLIFCRIRCCNISNNYKFVNRRF